MIRERLADLKIGQMAVLAMTAMPVMACCCCLLWVFSSIMLRDVLGILPTYTPTTTYTPTPTDTSTFTLTPMPTDTLTPIPTKTVTPSKTPTPSLTPIPTDMPTPSITPTPSNTPTATLSPTPTGPIIVIVRVNKSGEYVDIRNDGDQAQNLSGWRLVSERGNQSCTLSGILEPGQTLRVWALAEDVAEGGFNCGYSQPIWNNSESDPAVLYNAAGVEVARR